MVCDARIEIEPYRGIHGWIQVTNLLDANYQTQYGYPDPGWQLWAAQRLDKAQLHYDIVVVDELGLLEADGGGHMIVLKKLCQRPGKAKLLIAAVRQGCLKPIEEILGHPIVVLTAPVEENELNDAFLQILHNRS